MSSSAVARLAVGSLFAVGAVTLAVHLADEPASPASVSSPTVRVAAGSGDGTAYDAEPTTTMTGAARPAGGARTALEGTLDRPTPAGAPVPVDLDTARGVLRGFERLGPIHVDPVPEGVSLDDPTDTASLYARAGLTPPDQTWAADAAAPEQLTAASTVPPGTPSTKGLTQHVAPSCSGTGTDGKRVQVLYVRDSSTASRYQDVLPLLRNEIANVDDVFAVSARQTGGERRVRWVHQDCVPVVTEVVVPAGSLSSNFGDTITALSNLGYRDANRKYLAFTEAGSLCGVGTMYDDTRVSGNANDGYAASYARVDKGCWSTRDHSVAAHELTHTLGGVLASAPHATDYGHCYDESDLMCYDDGSGIAMRSVCGSAQEQLLDCNGDDYFNTAPPAGSFLASSWNTARSSFLDTPGPSSSSPTGGALTVTAAPSRTSAETGDAVSATATSSGATGFRWSVSQPCALTGETTATVRMVCPSTVSGPVDLVVTASDGNGGTATDTATVTLSRAAAPAAAVTVPAQVAEGGTFAASAQVTGKAPFTYRWSASAPCILPASSTATLLGSCASDSAGQASTVALTVTQADGQTVQATSAVVTVARADAVQGATTWSSPTVTAKDPAVISAVLTDQGSGSPLAGATVELQARSGAGGEWTTAVTGLVTRSDGRVGVERRRTAVASYRFAYAGAPDGSSTASVSPEVLVKARTISKAQWHGRKHLVTGRVLTVDGTPLRGVTVTLERRYAGSSHWVAVTRVTSDKDGRLRAKQHPRHTAYFRWSYRGSEQLLPARSASVRVRPSA